MVRKQRKSKKKRHFPIITVTIIAFSVIAAFVIAALVRPNSNPNEVCSPLPDALVDNLKETYGADILVVGWILGDNTARVDFFKITAVAWVVWEDNEWNLDNYTEILP